MFQNWYSTESINYTIKKETLAQVFSCEFCKIFKNTFFVKHLRITAPEIKGINQNANGNLFL